MLKKFAVKMCVSVDFNESSQFLLVYHRICDIITVKQLDDMIILKYQQNYCFITCLLLLIPSE